MKMNLYPNTSPETPKRTRGSWRGLLVATALAVIGLGQVQAGTFQVGSGSLTGTQHPIYSCYGYSYSQQIYLASEMQAATGVAGDITALRFKYTGGSTDLTPWVDWTVYIGNTSLSAFASNTAWEPVAGLTQVFSGTVTAVVGEWMEIAFTTPFAWDGVSNVVVAVDENTPDYDCTANWASYTATSNRAMVYYNDDNNPDPAAPPSANSGQPNATVPQIQFEGVLASCLAPSDITASDITTSSASFTWTDNGSLNYDYEVRSSGAAGSGPSGLIASGNVTSGTPAIALSGLSANTSYSIYVMSTCDDGSSFWSPASMFMTACGAMSIPYLQDFNAVTTPALPSCMSIETVSGNPWTTATAPTGMTGKVVKVSYTPSGSPDMDSWLYTEELTLTGGVSYRLTYKYFNNSTTYQENMSVSYGSDNSEAAMTTLLADHPGILTTTVQLGSVDFTPSTSGSYHIGFKCYSIADQNQLYLDDIGLNLTPSCATPFDVTTGTVTDNSADISWAASVSDPVNGYIWEVRSSGAPGDPSPDASGTTPAGVLSASASGLLANTTYSVYVMSDCGDGSMSEWTEATTFYTGYCVSTASGTSTYFSNFATTGGVDNISNATGLATNGYADYTAIIVSQAAGFDVSFATTLIGGSAGTAIWVDWNNDMDFADAGEQVFTTTSYGYDQAGSFTVPAGTPAGIYRMRIRCHYLDSTPDACGANTSSGETEDYTFEVLVQDICDATPNPGATTGPISICPDAPFTLGIENNTIEAGISYQWQSSSDGVTWTDVSGADLATYATSQTEETWYQVLMTCEANGTTASDPLMVMMNGFMDCYCTNIPSYTADEDIFNVTLGSLNNSSDCATLGSGDGSVLNLYSNYTDVAAPDLMTGSNLPISVQVGTCGTFNYTNVVAVFIDYNQNGILNDPGELVYSGAAVSGPHVSSGFILIPTDAMPGNTMMRVINSETSTPITDPCGAYFYGETEDYIVNIVEAVVCTGTPAPGNTLSTADVICADVPFTLSMSDFTPATGLTVQWQSSVDGTTWVDIDGATLQIYTTSQAAETYYQAVVTCDGADGISTPLLVTMSPATDCYCTPGAYTYDVEPICNVTFADINNDSPSAVNGTPDLEDFTAIVGHVEPGMTYSLSATGNTNGSYTTYITAFFDWDANGSFETMVPIGSMTNEVCVTPASADITVPANAVIGSSRMRVMKNYNSSPEDPCGTYGFGQSEDYTLQVGAGGITDCEGVEGGDALPGTACIDDNGLAGTWSEDCQCVVIDCEGEAGGAALPGTNCIGDNGFGGIWSGDCACVENVGVDEITAAGSVAVFPNPASTILYITTADGRAVHAQVYDMVGHLVMEQDMVKSLDIAGLATGSYTLLTTDENGGHRAHSHFVKQ